VIVVTTTFLAVDARSVSSTIPIVMAASTDPVERGLAASLSRPGGNVTGFTVQAEPEYEAKRLQFLKEAVPNLSHVAFFGTKGEWDLPNAKALRSAAQQLGLTLKLADYTSSNYSDALSSIASDCPDGLFISLTPVGPASYKAILAFALEHRLPTIYPWRQNAVDGGLMSFGIDLRDQYRRVAGYVAKILKGEKPGEMAIQRPVSFEFVVNLKTARAIGLEIPAPVLAQAAEVIE
jgi:putative ABC transport system substrate-binding protein